MEISEYFKKQQKFGLNAEQEDHKLTEEYIAYLASFPQLNPNPIIEVDSSGNITLFNSGAQKTLEKLGIDKGSVNVFLPSDIGEILQLMEKTEESSFYREVAVKDRIFGETIYLAPQLNVARIYATDITERRGIEKELSRLNTELNTRTSELQTILDTAPVATGQDVTRRKKAEEALRQNERRLSLAISATADAIWEWNLVTQEVYYSPRWYEILGYSNNEICMTFEGWKDLCHPEDFQPTMELIRSSLKSTSNPGYTAEFRMRAKDGSWVWILGRGRVVECNSAGEPVLLSGTNTDITQRKQKEEELNRLNRAYRALSNSSQVVIRAADERSYLKEACRIIIEDCGHAMVWIGLAENDEAKTVRPVAHFGFEEGYLETLNITWADTERGKGPTGTAIRTGKPSLCKNMLADPKMQPWREEACKRGYASSIVVPLLDGGKAFGAISIYSRETNPFSEDEVKLLSELADDMSYGIGVIRLREANVRAEESLRRNAAELADAQRIAHIGSWYWDAKTNAITRSEELLRIYGFDPAAEGMQTFNEQRRCYPIEDWELVNAAVRKTLETGVGYELEVRVKRGKDFIWVMTRSEVVLDASGQIAGLLGTVQDITERKQTEASLRKSEEALQRANTILEQKVRERTANLDEMVKALRKEIQEKVLAEEDLKLANQQLGNKTNQLRILAGELTMAEQRERKRMATILHDDLQQQLALAKIQVSCLETTDKVRFSTSAKNIEDLLSQAINVSRTLTSELSPPILFESGLKAGLDWLARWEEAKYGLKIFLTSEENIPELEEDIRIMLFSATRELLFNTIKHAKVDSAEVELSRTEEGNLHITVSDSGKGFDLSKIKPAGETGAGYGLFSIRERLHNFGGNLEINSAPGKGSRFIMTIPIASVEPESKATSVETNDAPKPEISADSQKNIGQIRVLIVDDHAMLREGLAGMLNIDPDIEVIGQAQNGYEAIEKAGIIMPDVILMDISMPILNGIDATQAIHEKYPGICIIGLSMYEEKEKAEEMQNAGASAYITKSGPRTELIATIKNCMKR